jgi:ferredoxin
VTIRPAELLPETIDLDEWGYPIIGPLPDRLVPLARRTVADCPTLALLLERDRAH